METKNNFFAINGRNFKKFILEEEINRIVGELACRINEDYNGKEVLFLLILKGSIFFASDILRKITVNCRIDTITAKSYGNKMESSGNVSLDFNNIDVFNQHIIIIEDIIDTGYTLKALCEKLMAMKPASIEIATFLSKPELRKVEVPVKYIGREIPPVFVIGYGLDYAELGRHLPDIYEFVE